jgi:hypothetical protein
VFLVRLHLSERPFYIDVDQRGKDRLCLITKLLCIASGLIGYTVEGGGEVENRMAVSLFSLVGSAFCGVHHCLHCGASRVKNVWGVMVMLKYLMYPKVGFWILHATVITLLFLLGFSIHFK